MKKLILLIVLFWSLFAAGSETANGQERRLSSTPKAFQTFYAKFRSAMIKDDKRAVASLTLFPFIYGFDTGDEGTLSKAQFIKRFDRFFGKNKKLFAQKNPQLSSEAGNYDLTDEYATHFIFEKKGASYKFTARIVEP
jgi:hypothetical protein